MAEFTPASTYRLGLRVYWEDTDAGGVVFHANYLRFFERARTEWLREAGFEQRVLRETSGVIFVVSQAGVRYLRPARLDDWLEVGVQAREIGAATMTLLQQARRGSELLAEAEVRIGCVDAASLRPRRIPVKVLERIRP